MGWLGEFQKCFGVDPPDPLKVSPRPASAHKSLLPVLWAVYKLSPDV